MAFINSADYGVPQNRVRMIVRATKNLLSPMIPTCKNHVSWWDAVEDLVEGFNPVELTAREQSAFAHELERYQIALFDVQNMGRDNLTIRDLHEPAFTMTASAAGRHPLKAKINGEYRRLSVRACARFQSFPDWYQLPDKASLASYVVGNAVPPLLYRHVIDSIRVYL